MAIDPDIRHSCSNLLLEDKGKSLSFAILSLVVLQKTDCGCRNIAILFRSFMGAASAPAIAPKPASRWKFSKRGFKYILAIFGGFNTVVSAIKSLPSLPKTAHAAEKFLPTFGAYSLDYMWYFTVFGMGVLVAGVVIGVMLGFAEISGKKFPDNFFESYASIASLTSAVAGLIGALVFARSSHDIRYAWMMVPGCLVFFLLLCIGLAISWEWLSKRYAIRDKHVP
jgi:hypothetical protein